MFDLKPKQVVGIGDFYYHKNHEKLKLFRKWGLYDIFKKNKMILAGGAINGILTEGVISDYDFYFKDKKYIESFNNDIDEYNQNVIFGLRMCLTYQSSNAISCSIGTHNFQFITLENTIRPTAMEIIEQFDFSICQGAYDFEYDNFFVTEAFLRDNDSRTISYNLNSKYPISSIFRVAKYSNRGYHMNTIEMLKLILSVEKLGLKTYEDVIDCLSGVSTIVFEDLIKLLSGDNYKDKKYNLEDFLEIIEDYMNAKKVMEKLIREIN